MATLASGSPAGSSDFRADQRFFRRFAIGISLLVVFAFAQWSARGFVKFADVPVSVHLHGLLMLSWLALFVTQNLLAERGAFGLHRRLGWASCGLAAAVLLLGTFVTVRALQLHRVPGIFTNPYFLALGPVDTIGFLALFVAAIVKRRDVEWHRRLMLGAVVLLTEPAFGRLVPPPLFFIQLPLAGPLGAVIERVAQLALLAVAMRHDRQVRGVIHPALLWGAGAVIAAHFAILALAANPAFAALAERLAAG